MFTLDEILLRASKHPMYTQLLSDKPHHQSAEKILPFQLQDFPTIDKAHLISGFSALLQTDPTALHAAYLSPTGGTRGGTKQLYFVSDTRENRVQRDDFAQRVLCPIGVYVPTDIVVNLHGDVAPMYRCQELIGTLIEFSGATELGVGGAATDEAVVSFTAQFGANVVTGMTSRIMRFAEHIAAHPETFPKVAKLTKVVYSSESMTRPQEQFLRRVLKNIEVVASVYGSSEAGPWAASVPQRDVRPEDRHWNDFVFDSEMMVVEVLAEDGLTVLADSRRMSAGGSDAAEDDDFAPIGELVLTSLSRARNPLVRYRTGDFGSLHRYSGTAAAGDRDEIASGHPYCRLRLHGRNPEKSFDLNGDYMDCEEFEQRVFSKPEYRVLQWQVIIDSVGAGGSNNRLEFRVVAEGVFSEEECHLWEEKVQEDIVLNVVGLALEVVVKKVGYDLLERGRIARKVVKVLDRREGRRMQ
jgi:phenylacetate-coenzyme A ligase PaaK-like adenylate-forming protein